MQSHKSEAVSESNNESLGEIDVDGRKSRKLRSQIIPEEDGGLTIAPDKRLISGSEDTIPVFLQRPE